MLLRPFLQGRRFRGADAATGWAATATRGVGNASEVHWNAKAISCEVDSQISIRLTNGSRTRVSRSSVESLKGLGSQATFLNGRSVEKSYTTGRV